MPSEPEFYQRLTEIFHDVFSRDDITLRPDLTAKDVAGWDSFRQVEILMAVQEVFNIKFSTREMDGLANVGDLVKVIASKVPAA
jgi:acyl carrier protein